VNTVVENTVKNQKFGKLVHYGPRKRHDLALTWLFMPLEQRDINLLTYLWLKPRTTGENCRLKWQCSA